MFRGARGFRALKVNSNILKIMCCFTGSRWRSLRTGVNRSYLQVQGTRHAAAFCTCWTLSNKYCGSSASNELQLPSLVVTKAWTDVSVLRMWKKATLQKFWTSCLWFITSLNITPMFLADSVGTTLTPPIFLLMVGNYLLPHFHFPPPPNAAPKFP